MLLAAGAVVAQFERGTLGGAAGGHVVLLMTDLNAVQRAILLIDTVIGAAGNTAFNAGVCVLVIHNFIPPFWVHSYYGKKEAGLFVVVLFVSPERIYCV